MYKQTILSCHLRLIDVELCFKQLQFYKPHSSLANFVYSTTARFWTSLEHSQQRNTEIFKYNLPLRSQKEKLVLLNLIVFFEPFSFSIGCGLLASLSIIRSFDFDTFLLIKHKVLYTVLHTHKSTVRWSKSISQHYISVSIGSFLESSPPYFNILDKIH